VPTVLGQRDLVRLTVHVPGQVFGGPAELEQRLLQPAALRGMYRDRLVVDASAEHAGQLLVLRHLDQHDAVEAAQDEAVTRVVDELQAAVPVHGLGHVHEQRVRHRVAGELDQRVDHAFGVVAGGPRVPQPERSQPVRVHVLRRALELGERGDRHPARLRVGVVHLQQKRLVRLHDQWSAAHHQGPSKGDIRPSSVTRP
jgi:hypothetical protein